MRKYIITTIILILIFLSYCAFLWYNPKASEGFDYMFWVTINAQLLEKIKISEENIKKFWNSITGWIENPAPNSSDNLDRKMESIKTTKENNN